MFIDFLIEREGGEREKHWSVTPYMGLTRDTAYNLGMYPDQELNLKPFLCAGWHSNWAYLFFHHRTIEFNLGWCRIATTEVANMGYIIPAYI